MRTHHRHPENAASALLGVDADKAFSLSIQNGTIGVSEFSSEGVDLQLFFPRNTLSDPNVRDLRIGVCAPRDHQVAHSPTPKKKSILQSNPRHTFRGVRKFVDRADISSGVNVGIARLKSLVDGHAIFIKQHAGHIKIEAVKDWLAPDGQQNLLTGNTLFAPPAIEYQLFMFPAVFRPQDSRSEDH